MPSRACRFCKAELAHDGGWETSARERGGNAVSVDTFRCTGCGRRYTHRIDERFDGDIHQWWMRDEDDEPTPLAEPDWPRGLARPR